MSTDPQRPYYSVANGAPEPRPVEPRPCGCGCGAMVPRDERSLRAKYINDTHKVAALRRRDLRRAVHEAGCKLGESGRRLPKTLHADDEELREVFLLGFEVGRKRRSSGGTRKTVSPAAASEGESNDGLEEGHADTLDSPD